jgi:hypothetical protein
MKKEAEERLLRDVAASWRMLSGRDATQNIVLAVEWDVPLSGTANHLRAQVTTAVADMQKVLVDCYGYRINTFSDDDAAQLLQHIWEHVNKHPK